jgi:site-specific DNA-methyltransferase (adenine-specific)/adenine-specific DNA-methyltransferase
LTHTGGTVLDPYCGVGSSLIAAIKNDRKAIGAEFENEYVKIATDRIQKFQMGELPIRPLGKPIHKPSGREKVAQRPFEWGSED